MRQNLTVVPTALAGLTEGTAYTLQNRASRPMFVEEAASQPVQGGTDAFVIGTGGHVEVTPGTGQSIWVSASSPVDLDTAFCIYEEAS